MTQIHPTAIVSPKAELGENVVVEPFAVIEDDVEIGNDSWIGPHAVIYDGARLGERVKIYQGANVSNVPQDLKFTDEKTYFYVGDDTSIRESVTLHRGTEATGMSKVGKKCLIMAYSHVAHDCVLGDEVILSNCTQLAGHVTIHDYVVCGGAALIPQFLTVGRNVMVGAGVKLTTDVPPFVLVGGMPARFSGLNIVGLRRRGFTNDEIMLLKKAYQILYSSGLNISQGVEQIKKELDTTNQYLQMMLNFITESKRGLLRR